MKTTNAPAVPNSSSKRDFAEDSATDASQTEHGSDSARSVQLARSEQLSGNWTQVGLWSFASVVAFFAYGKMVMDSWGAATTNQIPKSIWLPSILWLTATITYGLWAAFKAWDRKLLMAQGWNTWLFLASIVLATVSLFSGSTTLASAGLASLIASFAFTHQQKTNSDGEQRSLSAYAVIGLGAILFPTAISIPAAEYMAFVVAQSSSFVLSLANVPFQIAEGTILAESGDIPLNSLGLDLTTRVSWIFALFWMARHERAWFALPLYGIASLLWTLGLALTQVFYLVTFSATTGSTVAMAVLTLTGLAFSAAMMVSADRLLRVLLFEIPLDTVSRKNNPLIQVWNRIFAGMTTGRADETANQGLHVS